MPEQKKYEELEHRIRQNEGQLLALEAAHHEITVLNEDLERRSLALEQANRQLETFTYSISHDLRIPLRHIHAFSLLLHEECDDGLSEKGKQYLKFIGSGCQRMLSLVDDLMSFCQLSQQPVLKVTVQTDELLQEVLFELLRDHRGRRIDIQVGDLPTCQADLPLMRQVFMNLISNALKYSSKRKKPVIEVGSCKQEGVTAFFVRDNGVGFNMQFADRIFGAFQRLHVGDYEGTGVGLAIVANIVQRHGGRVWAEAEEGRGATFYFTLDGERS